MLGNKTYVKNVREVEQVFRGSAKTRKRSNADNYELKMRCTSTLFFCSNKISIATTIGRKS